MENIRLTKGELKKQRDYLRQYERYLPTLQLKKQQLQLEILRQMAVLEERRQGLVSKMKSAQAWLGLLAEGGIDLRPFLKAERIITEVKNIAGADIPLFARAEFAFAEYDLFTSPLWLDAAVESLRQILSLRQELRLLEKGIGILRQELRITAQRVNLFEKVKIPAASQAIRLIKIYLGDQMVNSVGRSKMAKNKIEEGILTGVAA